MLDLGLGLHPIGEWALIVIGIAALPIVLWIARRLLLAAIASRCPHCGSKFHAVPVCGDRRYERWHCRACERDWDERYDDWDPRDPDPV